MKNDEQMPADLKDMAAEFSLMKILIVDDEPLNVTLLEELLSESGFRNFTGTTDPRRILELWRDFQPDLILLDLMMPHIDGFGAMQQLAGVVPKDAYLPILVLTGDATSTTKHRALSAGATDFLTKPFDHLEVILRVKNLLQTRRQHLQIRDHNELLEEKVRERTEELRKAQEQLIQQERMRALGLMAGGVAHDFNNALTIILGLGEIVLQKCEQLDCEETLREDMQSLILTAQDAAEIVVRLREFHRAPSAEDAHLPVDLNACVTQAVSLTKRGWRNRRPQDDANIHTELDLEEIPSISGDAVELREAITNLIFNAVDAMPAGGTLTLRTSLEGGQVHFVVRDTGVGMNEEVRQHCLEPFFTTKGDSGTGLGLAMVYGIVQRHHGTVEIESALGRGTTFSFKFPASSAQEAIEFSESNSELQLNTLSVGRNPFAQGI